MEPDWDAWGDPWLNEDVSDNEPEDDFCDCEEYDADPIEGIAHCHRCGRHWFMTDEQIKAELRFQAEYAEQEAEEAARASQSREERT